MSKASRATAVAILLALTTPVVAVDLPMAGRAPTEAELAGFTSVQPDGRGLPSGSGTVAAGKAIFADRCASCHGDGLGGGPAVGAPALIGGRGTLTTIPPKKTVESYWPYPTTLFDYIKRAMPFDAPGSLGDDQVYALCAYILAQAHVIDPGATMDKASLTAVVMPNKSGFRPVSDGSGRR